MYPGTDYPTFRNEMADFAALKVSVEEATYAGDQLNTVVSWALSTDAGEEFFGVLVFMPRLSQTAWWITEHFNPAEVEAWVDSFLIPCVFAWFAPQLRVSAQRAGMLTVAAVKGLLKSRGKMIRQRGREAHRSADARWAHMEIADLLDHFADRFPRDEQVTHG